MDPAHLDDPRCTNSSQMVCNFMLPTTNKLSNFCHKPKTAIELPGKSGGRHCTASQAASDASISKGLTQSIASPTPQPKMYSTTIKQLAGGVKRVMVTRVAHDQPVEFAEVTTACRPL